MRKGILFLIFTFCTLFVSGCGKSVESNVKIIVADFFTNEFHMEQGFAVDEVCIKSIEEKDDKGYHVKGIVYTLNHGEKAKLRYYFRADIKKIEPRGVTLVSRPRIALDREGNLTENNNRLIELFWNNDEDVFKRVVWGEFSK